MKPNYRSVLAALVLLLAVTAPAFAADGIMWPTQPAATATNALQPAAPDDITHTNMAHVLMQLAVDLLPALAPRL